MNFSYLLVGLVDFTHIHDLNLIVKYYYSMMPSHTHHLYTQLCCHIINEITTKNLSFHPNKRDTFICYDHISDTYTIKSGYNWILTQKPNHCIVFGNYNSQRKSSFLFWFAFHNYVPTLSPSQHELIDYML